MDTGRDDHRKDIASWTDRERNRAYKTPLNTEIGGIDLTTGSPGWTPFEPAIAAVETMNKRPEIMNRYQSTKGTFKDVSYPEFFKSIGIVLPDGKPVNLDNCIPGNGATHLYAATVQNILEEKDVLLVPVPTYGFFLEPENLRGKRVVPLLLRPEDGFRLTAHYLDSQMQRINAELAQENPPKKITAFLHMNPHNPTGAVDTRQEVEGLASIIKKHDLRLVIDDLAYLGMEYDRAKTGPENRLACPMAAVEGMFERTLTITSLSKAYSLVGFRAGMAVGPEEFIGKLKKNIQRTSEFVNNSAQIALNAVYDPKNADKRNEYLADHAKYLKQGHDTIRILINGWDNDTQARKTFHDSPDEFLETVTSHRVIGSHEKLDSSKIDTQRIALDEKAEAISLSKEMIDEAKPHALREIQEQDNELIKQMFKQRIKFYTARQSQAWLRRLMPDGIPGMKVINSTESGFFLLVDASAFKGKYYDEKQIRNSTDFTQLLSEQSGVYAVSGNAMGYTGNELLLRLSFPHMDTECICGLARLKNFTQHLKDEPHKPAPQKSAGTGPSGP